MTIEHKLTLPGKLSTQFTARLFCILIQSSTFTEAIAPPLEPSTQRDDSGEESDDNADEEQITELMFAPLDQDALPRMYSAMCDCQAMHPDPNDSFTDEGTLANHKQISYYWQIKYIMSFQMMIYTKTLPNN